MYTLCTPCRNHPWIIVNLNYKYGCEIVTFENERTHLNYCVLKGIINKRIATGRLYHKIIAIVVPQSNKNNIPFRVITVRSHSFKLQERWLHQKGVVVFFVTSSRIYGASTNSQVIANFLTTILCVLMTLSCFRKN